MHAVDIGIGGNNHLVVAQVVDTVLDVEGGLQQAEFFVLHHLGRLQPEGVERLSAQREHRLRLHISYLGDAAACREALGDENRAFLAAVVVFWSSRVVEVHTAVAQLAVVERHLLGPLTGLLGDAGNGFALTLAFLYFLEQHLGSIGILVQVVVELLLDEVVDKLVDGGAVFPHDAAAQLNLGLRLKDRFLYLDGNGGHDAVANVAILEVLAIELLDGA